MTWNLERNKIDDSQLAEGAIAYDMTDNGDYDVVVAGDDEGTVLWYEHPGEDDVEDLWDKYVVHDGLTEVEGSEVGDVDDDGVPELFGFEQDEGKVSIHKAPDGDIRQDDWDTQILDNEAELAQNGFLVDIDGSGVRDDLVYTYEGDEGGTGGLYWLDFQGGDPLDTDNWTKRTIVQEEGAWQIIREWIDLEGEGDRNIIFSARRGRSSRNPEADGGIFWVRRPSDPHDTPWDQFDIDRGEGRLHIDVADISGNDVRKDIVSTYVTGDGSDDGDGFGWYEYPGEDDVTDVDGWDLTVLDSSETYYNIKAHNWTGSDRDQLVVIDRSSSPRHIHIWEYNDDSGDYEKVADHVYGKADDQMSFVDIDGDGEDEIVTGAEGNSDTAESVDWWKVTYPGGNESGTYIQDQYENYGKVRTGRVKIDDGKVTVPEKSWEDSEEEQNVVLDDESVSLEGSDFSSGNVVSHYDATEESSTGSTNTISDLEADMDLSGSCEVISDGINGMKSYSFDGDSDLMEHTDTISTSDPFAIVFVFEQQEPTFSNNCILDGGTDQEFFLQDDNDDGLEMRRGSSSSPPTNSDATTTDPVIYVAEGYDGDRVRLRQNGVEVIDGSGNSADLTGLMLAERRDERGLNMEAYYGEVIVLNNHTEDDVDDVESYLSDKWGVSI